MTHLTKILREVIEFATLDRRRDKPLSFYQRKVFYVARRWNAWCTSVCQEGKNTSNYRNRIGEAIAFARNVAGRSQQELADMLGRDKRTIQKWERGEIRIALEDFLDVFDTLHLPVGPYEMWIRHPELFPRGMEDIKGFSTEKKRRTLADYYLHQAAPLEIEQEYYILFGDHGSNSCGIRQELLANLQTPLRDRKRIVNQIIDNYYEARAIGHLTDPEGQQPVMPILEACYDASARSVKANENRYSIGSIENYLDDAEKPAEE